MFGFCQDLKIRVRRCLSRLRFGLLFCACVVLCARGFGAEPKFSTSLDRTTVVVGETVSFTMQFEGVQPGGNPSVPPIPGLQAAGGISTSVNQSVGPDGAMTSVMSYSVTYVAQQVGTITIPALTVSLNGQQLRSQPLTLKVLQSDPNTPPAENGEKLAFLWLGPLKKEMYLGEVMPVEMRLYVRGDVSNIRDAQLPPLRGDGFISGKLVEGQRFQRRVGNMSFT